MPKFLLVVGLSGIATGGLGYWIEQPISAGLFIGLPCLVMAAIYAEDE